MKSYLFPSLRHHLSKAMLTMPFQEGGLWQSQENAQAATIREMVGVAFDLEVHPNLNIWADHVGPNLPWAEHHFLERVSGIPYNPPPSSSDWPFAQIDNKDHKMGEKFSHTYPERMWPPELDGIRFSYGNLLDVVNLLVSQPLTRQAYLPIWFPEDTGVVHGERVPCSIGYHFMLRQDKLYCWYFMRSCDFIRHFQDDLYMAGRLMQWVADQVEQRTGKLILTGTLYMSIASLHSFKADTHKLKEWAK